MANFETRIGFIGSGKLAESIARILRQKITPDPKFCYTQQRIISNINASDPLHERRQVFNQLGFTTTSNNEQVIADSDLVFIALKPKDSISVMSQLKNNLTKGKLFVSLVNGLPSMIIEQMIPGARVIRMVPSSNTIELHKTNSQDLAIHHLDTLIGSNVKETDIQRLESLFNNDSTQVLSFQKEETETLPQSMVMVTNMLKQLRLEEEMKEIEKHENILFHEKYKIIKTLGHGHYSHVFHAINRQTKTSYAVKSFHRASLNSIEEETIIREISALSRLQHSNIREFHGFFSETDYYYIIQNYMPGGNLQDYINRKLCFTEIMVKRIAKQLFDAVKYCHEMNHVHRDIKLDNILVNKNPFEVSNFSICLSDFGLSKELNESNQSLYTYCGTLGYISPEIASGQSYGKSTDLWSVGVVLYILISGNPPFYDRHPLVLKKLIQQGYVKFPNSKWNHISPECKDLILKLLQTDPLKRINATDSLMHPWFQKIDTMNQ